MKTPQQDSLLRQDRNPKKDIESGCGSRSCACPGVGAPWPRRSQGPRSGLQFPKRSNRISAG
jgi:hypothetical protein